ncbi:hypothetical protein EVAR_44545_1 [Eumeta japonica]|uniref:Uncharacterized protein n=1 Tax=Eumeta variegata TaxID=151549 RepID=A0A4C1XBX0_EUMVA|nr:hypothetical protein EVAR_44545_1 [Eumeta japonica]
MFSVIYYGCVAYIQLFAREIAPVIAGTAAVRGALQRLCFSLRAPTPYMVLFEDTVIVITSGGSGDVGVSLVLVASEAREVIDARTMSLVQAPRRSPAPCNRPGCANVQSGLCLLLYSLRTTGSRLKLSTANGGPTSAEVCTKCDILTFAMRRRVQSSPAPKSTSTAQTTFITMYEHAHIISS